MSLTVTQQLHCVLGTRAQIIKMAPIIKWCEQNGQPINLILTGQHKETVETLFADFGIQSPRVHVYQGPEISGIGKMAWWLPMIIWKLWADRKRYFPSTSGIVLVHGDTVSTLAGAIVGRLLSMRVAHIESGLRSFNWFHPFPEELTRLAVFRLSNIAYCPGEWAVNNMKRYSAELVDTRANSIVDAVDHVMATPSHDFALPADNQGYGVISIHRFENIFRENRLNQIVAMLEYAAQKCKLVFVLHPATEKRLKRLALYERLEKNPMIQLVPRMGYAAFIRVIMRSDFVVTDGGGNQEELSLTDIPVLIMRKATERQEGIGKNITLGQYDEAAFKAFIDNVRPRRDQQRILRPLPDLSPSEIICRDLISRLA